MAPSSWGEYTRDGGMPVTMIGRIAAVISLIIARRRLHWVEISVEKAWSRDMLPRLFDLGDP